jgi:hypothetical protein
MNKPKIFPTFLLCAIIFVTSCTGQKASPPPLQAATAAGPSADEIRTQAASTVIAEFATAQPTRTSSPLPSPTLTITLVPSPTFESTATEVYAPDYPTRTWTPVQDNFRCRVDELQPAWDTTYPAEGTFDLHVELKNSGDEAWEAGRVQFTFTNGERMQKKTSAVGLVKRTEKGQVAQFTVDMVAPENPGTYDASWALQRGPLYFCIVHFQIIVNKVE